MKSNQENALSFLNLFSNFNHRSDYIESFIGKFIPEKYKDHFLAIYYISILISNNMPLNKEFREKTV